jgi:hypothetical protein
VVDEAAVVVAVVAAAVEAAAVVEAVVDAEDVVDVEVWILAVILGCGGVSLLMCGFVGRGGGRGGKGKAGAKVIVEQHRHAGVFIAKGKEDAL